MRRTTLAALALLCSSAAHAEDTPTWTFTNGINFSSKPACALVLLSGIPETVTVDWACVERARDTGDMQTAPLARALLAVRNGTAKDAAQ